MAFLQNSRFHAQASLALRQQITCDVVWRNMQLHFGPQTWQQRLMRERAPKEVFYLVLHWETATLKEQ